MWKKNDGRLGQSLGRDAGKQPNERPQTAIDFFLSLAGHGLLVATAILVPLYFSNALDLHPMETTYVVAPPPPPPAAPAAVVRAIRHPKRLFPDKQFYAPRVIPKHIVEVKDLPNAPQTIMGVPGGVVGGFRVANWVE